MVSLPDEVLSTHPGKLRNFEYAQGWNQTQESLILLSASSERDVLDIRLVRGWSAPRAQDDPTRPSNHRSLPCGSR